MELEGRSILHNTPKGVLLDDAVGNYFRLTL
jgi:hypothetical protein